jgi:Lar family restriction alleviation protein
MSRPDKDSVSDRKIIFDALDGHKCKTCGGKGTIKGSIPQRGMHWEHPCPDCTYQHPTDEEIEVPIERFWIREVQRGMCYSSHVKPLEAKLKEQAEEIEMLKKDKELLPCPFCGGEAEYDYEHMIGDVYAECNKVYSVQCNDCEAYVFSDFGEKECIELWNTRSQSK